MRWLFHDKVNQVISRKSYKNQLNEFSLIILWLLTGICYFIDFRWLHDYPKWCYHDVSLTYLMLCQSIVTGLPMTCHRMINQWFSVMCCNNLSLQKWYLSDFFVTLQSTVTGLSIKFQSNEFLMISHSIDFTMISSFLSFISENYNTLSKVMFHWYSLDFIDNNHWIVNLISFQWYSNDMSFYWFCSDFLMSLIHHWKL